MQRINPISAIAQALDVELEDLARRYTGFNPAAFCVFSEKVLVVGIKPDGQRDAVIALGHSETPFAALRSIMRFRYEEVNKTVIKGKLIAK